MNPMTEMFDFSKNMEAFTKFYPDMTGAPPVKAMTDMAEKYRAVTVEAMNKNMELTTAWMRDAARDAAVLMAAETSPDVYARKAGEVATTAIQDLPARLMAYADIARKAQADLLETVLPTAAKAEAATADTTKAARPARKPA
jgi:accessory colonization factor AcfC